MSVSLAPALTVRTVTLDAEWPLLRDAWNGILAEQSSDILQLDLTCSFDWAQTLRRSHLAEKQLQVFVLEEDAAIVGILPVYAWQKQVHGLPCRAIAPLNEQYAGRSGFLLADPKPAHLEALFAAAGSSWDVFQFSVLEGSSQEREVFSWLGESKFSCEKLSAQTSPYIVLQENWPQHFASLPKKLRSTIRNGEKRLRELGSLKYREIRYPHEIEEFVAVMLDIERNSWKEGAGTSLSTNLRQEKFHTDFLKSAAHNGWLCSHLLLLDDQPVAYIYGLLYNGVFSDLKESYHLRYREASPGHVLKSFAFESLYARQARLYDFMGNCEEYKMKWTDRTYTRASYLLFNGTARAWAARHIGSFRQKSRIFQAAGGRG